MLRWHAGRAKIQLKLAIQRARMLQQKKESLAKRGRYEIAELAQHGKWESARVKTESLIMDDVHVELLELLELYTETLYARFALLDTASTEPDAAVLEAVLAILYAGHRTELPELTTLRDMLIVRYGMKLATCAEENEGDFEYKMPALALVDAYLTEICKTYGVCMPGAPPQELPVEAAPSTPTSQSEWDALVGRFATLKR
ncbi:Vacuolar protein sorting-associated protein ist1 [Malassezia vespertilionis]|uniref:Vacuolar protein sorting-associated protein ist1 n=1 Tax=Malassezia vespertilionis TaxID=2020962 RepID=UPI0024B24139|nr:Vacuolar protein sorting-associated protein ist1 [Malassezia vespertilionis]WFD05640.1 Vacuolar protein sorting-associated protein ist1 [Malassezia vespertilionis]